MKGNKEDYIKYRILKSNEVFEDALLLLENKRWNSAVNRLYYSSFHLANALLYKSAIKADTHNGIKTQLFLHFVKTGKLSRKSGRLYAHLFDWRQESDYSDFIEFDEKTVLSIVPDVAELNKQLESLVLSAD